MMRFIALFIILSALTASASSETKYTHRELNNAWFSGNKQIWDKPFQPPRESLPRIKTTFGLGRAVGYLYFETTQFDQHTIGLDSIRLFEFDPSKIDAQRHSIGIGKQNNRGYRQVIAPSKMVIITHPVADGHPQYSPNETYPKGFKVAFEGYTYVSKIDNNFANHPSRVPFPQSLQDPIPKWQRKYGNWGQQAYRRGSKVWHNNVLWIANKNIEHLEEPTLASSVWSPAFNRSKIILDVYDIKDVSTEKNPVTGLRMPLEGAEPDYHHVLKKLDTNEVIPTNIRLRSYQGGSLIKNELFTQIDNGFRLVLTNGEIFTNEVTAPFGRHTEIGDQSVKTIREYSKEGRIKSETVKVYEMLKEREKLVEQKTADANNVHQTKNIYYDADRFPGPYALKKIAIRNQLDWTFYDYDENGALSHTITPIHGELPPPQNSTANDIIKTHKGASYKVHHFNESADPDWDRDIGRLERITRIEAGEEVARKFIIRHNSPEFATILGKQAHLKTQTEVVAQPGAGWNDPANEVTVYSSCKIKKQNYLSQQNYYPYRVLHSNGDYEENSYAYAPENKDYIIQTVDYSFADEEQNEQVLYWKRLITRNQYMDIVSERAFRIDEEGTLVEVTPELKPYYKK